MTQEGMDLDQMDVSGNTPLHLAARTGKTKTASALLNLGASVNMKVIKLFDMQNYHQIFAIFASKMSGGKPEIFQ